jgi:hypothetical protein
MKPRAGMHDYEHADANEAVQACVQVDLYVSMKQQQPLLLLRK